MAATLSYCPACPTGKNENKRVSKWERRSYHKLLRRMSKNLTKKEVIAS